MEAVNSMKVRLTFLQPLLGTASGNKEVAREFILAKNPGPEQIPDEDAELPDPEQDFAKAATWFYRDEKTQWGLGFKEG